MTETTGRFEGAEHVLRLRVYYEDTDAGGIVYHASYLRFAERGRTEMMRDLGLPHSRMTEEEGASFAARRCAVDYLVPARLDDLLEVRTRVEDVGGATLDLVQTVRRVGDGDGTDLARLAVRLACINRAGRPVRLPAALRAAVTDFLPPSHRRDRTT